MISNFQLSKEQIIDALTALNGKLAAKEVTGELCIFGGAAMILAFDARQSTRDVDGIFVPKAVVSGAVEEVAQELDLPQAWLNDGVKGWVSSAGDLVADGMPQFTHLRVLRPSAHYLLAMKCLAARTGDYDTSGDMADVQTLIRHLGLKDANQVLEIVSRYYDESRLSPKTRYFVEEIMLEEGGVQ
ncbi:hypothetical protein EI77_02995 [Prosthecobacter fusiformis]|uniref:Nucleotidyltransferase AbiEii toxin of type IV toxin-antitoxin system n=1 Tax=Prosthecobacter fusiformis TaxID=48464 RepID=A0A4R7RUC9_9BACT|nr:hypothetical protein [Prosthecobacter fusiformis]TDU69342.1 hypothetical protein EI77_02995 [Prosthecobacter fusiformis]